MVDDPALIPEISERLPELYEGQNDMPEEVWEEYLKDK